ncbi:MAG: C4-dicarboxylate ABC transporter [Alteromonadaceae bacterium]|nr:C4-dicarboxylate ABC transporter [Alteromonadaceae bacterium]
MVDQSNPSVEPDNERQKKIQDVLGTETGGRTGRGKTAVVLFAIPFAWSLFQLWIASPLPYMFDFGMVNSTESRAIHLAFAMFLAFTVFPMFRNRSSHVPVYDWVLALLAAMAAGYLVVFYEELATRAGRNTTTDMAVAFAGILLLLEAARRSLGLPLTVIAAVFLTYSVAGPYMPDVIAHKGASWARLASHQWLTTEGVFGVALGVSTSFVFLFVLFGAFLEKAGAGNYFIKMAYSMLGHMRGGPAKAAVVASGLSGIVSGSSIANVVTTGTFTIPLMKKVGFPASKAGAVEVAASTNGQLTPPVMGAAAFLMVEYVGISYLDVVKHAILPALISYIALLYIVHLEAVKLNMRGITRVETPTLAQRLLVWGTVIVGMLALTLAVYYGIGWIKAWSPDYAVWIVAAGLVAIYVAVLGYASRFPGVNDELTAEQLETLPPVGPTVKAGLHFLLPVVVLVWCLTVERFSPGLSAFWAIVFLVFVIFTQRPLLVFFQKNGQFADAFRHGARDFSEGMVTGARNMIGIGVATAAAGIVVGTVTLTGIGLVMTEFVQFISGGNLLLILIFTAFICLILGMGLPTTANYIVVSTLMAPVIVALGAANGLVVPLIAVHLFVFYFGILADDTPPVGLAAYAAAAISGADPIRTGIQGFTYDIRTAILPFMFIFNNQLLLIGLTGWFDLTVTVVTAVIAMLVFAAATQRFWLVRCKWWEVVALLLIAFTLFRPGFWWDRIYPPTEVSPGVEVFERVQNTEPGETIRIQASGMDNMGSESTITFDLVLPEGDKPEERLQQAGLTLLRDGDRVVVEAVAYDSAPANAGLYFDWTIDSLITQTDRPPRELVFIPALALLGLMAFLQLRRRRAESVGVTRTA